VCHGQKRKIRSIARLGTSQRSGTHICAPLIFVFVPNLRIELNYSIVMTAVFRVFTFGVGYEFCNFWIPGRSRLNWPSSVTTKKTRFDPMFSAF